MAFVGPAVIIWSLVGTVSVFLGLQGLAQGVLTCYGAYYGVVEFSRLGGLAPPGTKWQVPQTYVKGAGPRRRMLIWGFFLGPGFFTRNPYAGFGAVVITVFAIDGSLRTLLAAATCGLLHAVGRAVALSRAVNHQGSRNSCDLPNHLVAIIRSIVWRDIDGCVLAILAGVALSVHARWLGA